MYDPLTQLPERTLLMDRLQQAIAFAHRRLSRIAVLCLSVEGYDALLAQQGSAVAESYLTKVALRIRTALREGDTIARLAEDNAFVLILNDLPDLQACEPTIDRLLAAIESTVVLDELVLPVNIRIGLTVFPQEQEHQAEVLLEQAEHALRQARSSGGNAVEYFAVLD